MSGGGRPARFAPGAQVRVRDEQWLVRKVANTRDGWMIEATGVSPFVRGTDAVFYEDIEGPDQIEVLDPKKTRLVVDDSPNHRRAVCTWRRCCARPRCRRPSTGWRSPTGS
ncbi:hypothetical protein [Actinophytocola sediminis]